MRALILIAMIALSANAKWETSHLKDGSLIIFNTETAQSYQEYQGSMIPLSFSSGTEMVQDEDGKKYIVPKSPSDLTPYPIPKKK